ncbi:MAG: 16S rRNA (cytosine(1402)-N(4))-methyltransferase RsmH [Acidobacteriota bacterium]|jgi:16S rRNA (cytosine1402-N4)-methyltransferase|nr:16S rRNA (cytosine(1402)-N(4))-methyltransferase RsmH [Acidobacteriota bacterium]
MGATALEKTVHGGEPGEALHVPVLLREVISLVAPRPGGVYVDGTVGLGGHSAAILERIQPGGLLLGIDRDGEALEKASGRLKAFGGSFRPVHDNYKNLPLALNRLGIAAVDGILLDMGVSSWQLTSEERGFSFQSDARLDMRMDRTQARTAADVVNETPEGELADIIYRFGEERLSRRIAAAIAEARCEAPITRCSQLAGIVSRAVPRHGFGRGRQRIHPATRTFQALRIAVNGELDGLEDFLAEACGALKPGGRLVVIAFHSLEDRIVKRAFRRLAGQCVCDAPPELCQCPREASAKVLTSRPRTPGRDELDSNPRARSARLRAVEKS